MQTLDLNKCLHYNTLQHFFQGIAMILEKIDLADKSSSKERLVVAAYQLFGERDPANVSIREISKVANTNIAAINYHFGSKDGLYTHLIDVIAEAMREKIDSFYQDFLLKKEQIIKSNIDDIELKIFYKEALKSILELILRAILQNFNENSFIHRIILREQMTPSSAFPLLYEKSLKHLFIIIDDLLSHIDTKSPSKTIKLRSHAIHGQIVVFVVANATIKERLGSDYYTDEDIEEITAIIKEHTENILHSFIHKDEI